MERLMEKVVVNQDGCWIFTGALDRHGYGKIGRGGKYGGMLKAHRVTFADRYGPTELPLDHLCRVTSCCNPEHLEAVPQRENVLRGDGAYGRLSERPHMCRAGAHLLSGPDDLTKDGKRCRRCLSEWRRTKYQLLREAGYSSREASARC